MKMMVGNILTEITPYWLREKALKNQRIHLIKVLRDMSRENPEVEDLGLKQAKDMIFSIMGDQVGFDPANVDLQRLYDLFNTYDVDKKSPSILKAIECAMETYETLGFDNVYDMIDIVIANFRKRT
jgi:hypothetical protein